MEMEMEMEIEKPDNMSIYKTIRKIKQKQNSIYNALKSIYSDSVFVGEISQLWPQLPLLANLRCGLWYKSYFDATCYFKSTDGHTNNWGFNTSRLNLHVALLAGQKGGCIVVDSTRKGKRFPDSMSKTIPIWTCVLNRAIARYRNKMSGTTTSGEGDLNISSQHEQHTSDWECSLHLPLFVPPTEKAAIEDRLDSWTADLEASGADISSISSSLKKPLRPLWISPKTVIWINEVPEYDSWDFTPILLVSASSATGSSHNRSNSEYSWNYIPGAGDDEESWARGLSPALFWNHVNDIINAGPEFCNQKVAEIVEKDRVYRAQRGQNAPQLTIKSSKLPAHNGDFSLGDRIIDFETPCEKLIGFSREPHDIYRVGSTNIAVGATRLAHASGVDCILNCDSEPVSIQLDNPETCLHLPIMSSKTDRSSLIRHLPFAFDFVRINLRRGKKLMICCNNGEDISICVCLAILTSLFTEEGIFDNGKAFAETCITKFEMRKRLVFICKYAVNARPSRGNLRQVYNFLIGDNVSS